jgi:hypothetical protein
MRDTLKPLLLIAGVALALQGCVYQRAQIAKDAKIKMVGMSKEKILRCMGPPANREQVGGTTVWTYQSGDGRTNTFHDGTATGYSGGLNIFGTSTSRTRSCRINVVMSNDAVVRVDYSGRTGGLITQGEQCAYAVENCAN